MTSPKSANRVSSLLAQMEFDKNPEPRCPCLLVIDVSRSMGVKNRIDQVNQGLQSLANYLEQDRLASLRAEIALLTFSDSHELVQDFVPASQFKPPQLRPQKGTNALPAIDEGLRLIASRKAQYQSNGINYYRPLLIFMTDGEIFAPKHYTAPPVIAARDKLAQAHNKRQIAFFAVGATQDASMDALKVISPTPPKRLSETRFPEFFQWLSRSLTTVSQSEIEDRIVLPGTEVWAI